MVILNEMKHVSPTGLGNHQLINTHAGNVAVFSLPSELLFLLLDGLSQSQKSAVLDNLTDKRGSFLLIMSRIA